MYKSLIISGLASMFAASIPGVGLAQFNAGEDLFTYEERQIINRQRELLRARGAYPDVPPEYFSPSDALQQGGSGLNRWAVLDARTDDFGNRYAIDTRQAQTLGKGSSSFYSPLTGTSYTVWRAQFVLQVTFVDPADRGGVARRNVVLEVECPEYQLMRNHFAVRRVRYDDYNTSGSLVGSHQINERYQLIDNTDIDLVMVAQGCEAAYTYPLSVTLLMQGQNPTGNQNPSPFDL